MNKLILLVLLGIVCIEISAQENTAENYLQEGDKYFGSKEYEQAIQSYTKAIQSDSQSYIAYRQRGRAKSYLNLSNCPDAVEDFNIALKFNPNDTFSYYNRANCKVWLKDCSGAIKDLDKAIHLKRSPGYFNVRATCYAVLKKYNLAIKDFSAAIEMAPDRFENYSGRAQLYNKRGNYELAILDYDRAIEFLPKSIPPNPREPPGHYYYERALCKKANGDYDGACKDALKSLGLKYNQAEGFVLKNCK